MSPILDLPSIKIKRSTFNCMKTCVCLQKLVAKLDRAEEKARASEANRLVKLLTADQ